jgi:hypothetical protein
LRFSRIIEFKHKLTDKIQATHKRASSDASYTTFLKHFGEFTVAKLEKKEISGQEFILEELKNIRLSIRKFERGGFGSMVPEKRMSERYSEGWLGADLIACAGSDQKNINRLLKRARACAGVEDVTVKEIHPDHKHIYVNVEDNTPEKVKEIQAILGDDFVVCSR